MGWLGTKELTQPSTKKASQLYISIYCSFKIFKVLDFDDNV